MYYPQDHLVQLEHALRMADAAKAYQRLQREPEDATRARHGSARRRRLVREMHAVRAAFR